MGKSKVTGKKDTPGFCIWGLTGGIASGKSAVAKILRRHGVTVVDADRISRRLSTPGGKAHPLLLEEFGTAERSSLRELVFRSPSARKKIESILHPLIRQESHREMEKARAPLTKKGKVLVFYEAALLVESGYYRKLDGLVVVKAPILVRKERLQQRDSIDPTLADQIIQSQLSEEERLQAADEVIDNSKSPADLEKQVQAILARLIA